MASAHRHARRSRSPSDETLKLRRDYERLVAHVSAAERAEVDRIRREVDERLDALEGVEESNQDRVLEYALTRHLTRRLPDGLIIPDVEKAARRLRKQGSRLDVARKHALAR